MKIVSLYFENKHYPEVFKKVFEVFKKSCEIIEDESPLEILSPSIDIPFNNKHSKKTQCWKNNNLVKMKEWNKYIQEAPTGEEVLLIDCDTFLIKKVNRVFRNKFDIAFTEDKKKETLIGNSQINTGVMFVRVSDRVKRFFNEWEKECILLYEDSKLWKESKKKLYGLTQPSFLECKTKTKINNIDFLSLPCHIYNSDPSNKKTNAKIVHVQNPYWLQFHEESHYSFFLNIYYKKKYFEYMKK